jgi:signal peptidase I
LTALAKHEAAWTPEPEQTPATVAASKKKKKESKGLLGSIRSIGPAVAVALAIRAFLFEPFSIPSGSMLPTLQIGDYVVVTKFAYGVRLPFSNSMLWQRDLPERGDVIVFERPTPPAENLIKRVVGLPGDEIQLIGGVLHVNGVAQPRELIERAHALDDYDELRRVWVPAKADLYVETIDDGAGGQRHFTLEQLRGGRGPHGPFVVPEGQLMVLGDNRDNSADSRAWGFVPLGHVRGRADVIGFSWGQDGLRTDRIFHSLDGEVPKGG